MSACAFLTRARPSGVVSGAWWVAAKARPAKTSIRPRTARRRSAGVVDFMGEKEKRQGADRIRTGLLDQGQCIHQEQVQRGVDLVLDLEELRGLFRRDHFGEFLEPGPLQLDPLRLEVEELRGQVRGLRVGHVLVDVHIFLQQDQARVQQLIERLVVLVVDGPELGRLVRGEREILGNDDRLLRLDVHPDQVDGRAHNAGIRDDRRFRRGGGSRRGGRGRGGLRVAGEREGGDKAGQREDEFGSLHGGQGLLREENQRTTTWTVRGWLRLNSSREPGGMVRVWPGLSMATPAPTAAPSPPRPPPLALLPTIAPTAAALATFLPEDSPA